MQRSIAIAALALCISACRPGDRKTDRPLLAAGLQTKWFTAISNAEVRLAPGVTASPIKNAKSVTLIARDNDSGFVTCQCAPGCDGTCVMEREDETGSTRFNCVGACSNSEGNPASCGAVGGSGGGSGLGTGSARPDPGGNRDSPPRDPGAPPQNH